MKKNRSINTMSGKEAVLIAGRAFPRLLANFDIVPLFFLLFPEYYEQQWVKAKAIKA